MTRADPIRWLASEYGIASEYIDARGEAVRADIAVRAKLLESMGVMGPATNPEAGETATPNNTMVVRANTGRVTIELGKGFTRSSVGWEIAFENGSARKGASEVVSRGPTKFVIHLRDIPCGYHQLIVEGSDLIN